MLRHEDNPDESVIPASQVRVTPQELAAALARLEVRREAEERRLDGTVPIGEAVQQLGLQATPEELLREIQAGRSKESVAQPQVKKANALGFSWALVSSLLLLTGLMMTHFTHPTPSPPASALSTPMPPQLASLTVPPSLLVQESGGKIVLLSEIADGRPVLSLLVGSKGGGSFADFLPGDIHWTLIKHDGKVYLRGWIADMSDTALRAGFVDIYPMKSGVPTGLTPLPVTLPVDSLQFNPGLTGDDMISASHITPDSHFREKW